MPVHSVEAAQAWRAENVGGYIRTPPDAAPAAAAPGRLDLAQERALLARSQRESVDLKNAVQRGTYAPITLLAEVLANASRCVAERFDHLPARIRKVHPTLPPAVVDEVMATIAAARNQWVAETVAIVTADIYAAGDADEEDVVEGTAP